MHPFDNRCRCCNTAMNGSDHCPECFCEEFEETCPRPVDPAIVNAQAELIARLQSERDEARRECMDMINARNIWKLRAGIAEAQVDSMVTKITEIISPFS